jgi:hypothetical protein
MPRHEWTFITSTGARRKEDDAARKIVRENAMRNFRHRQRVARVREYQLLQARTDGQDAGTLPGNLDEANERMRHFLVSSGKGNALLGAPGNGLDPFASTVLQNHHDGPLLFCHCESPVFLCFSLKDLGRQCTRGPGS